MSDEYVVEQILKKYIDDEIEVILFEEAPVKEEVILKFEKEIGFSLPSDFKEFCLSKYNTISINVIEDIWERPGCGSMGPSWTFSFGFDIHGFSDELDEDYHIPSLYENLNNNTDVITKAIPFMNITTDADPLCFLKNKSIWQYNYTDQEPKDCYDVSFYKFFEYQVRALMHRKEHYKKWKNGNKEFYEAPELDGYYI